MALSMFIPYLKLILPTKLSVLLGSLIAFPLFAQVNISANSEVQPESLCPGSFYQLNISEDARLCHLFADQLPASLSYHSDHLPEETAIFYRAQMNDSSTLSKVNDRILIESKNRSKIIVISKDGQGSQIDILVTSN